MLSLPTLNLVSVTEIDDDGQVLAAGDLQVSGSGLCGKQSGASWSGGLSSIAATFTTATEDEWRGLAARCPIDGGRHVRRNCSHGPR